jgi:hypothetical protein
MSRFRICSYHRHRTLRHGYGHPVWTAYGKDVHGSWNLPSHTRYLKEQTFPHLPSLAVVNSWNRYVCHSVYKLTADHAPTQPKQDNILLPSSQPHKCSAYPIRRRSIRNAAHPPRREKSNDWILPTRGRVGYGKFNCIHVESNDVLLD